MHIVQETELLRIKANSTLDPSKKGELGQFFTPSSICQYMASLFIKFAGRVKILDPGCGVGSLSAAVVEELIGRGKTTSVDLVAYDIDSLVRNYIIETFRLCEARLEAADIPFNGRFHNEDFIMAASDLCQKKTFKGDYTHVIMNPPYKKISSSSDHRKALRKVGIETVNLYSGFVALSLKLLAPGGELVAIIPRSFCNGPYYQPFREFLLSVSAIRHIHIFDSRSKAFADNEVLQENIIIHCIKGGAQEQIIITSSPGADFCIDAESNEITATDMTVREVDINSVVKPNDQQKFIHIAPTKREQHIVDRLSAFNNTLDDLGIEVSTGPVVGFRLKGELRKDYNTGNVPLIYPAHINGKIDWPKKTKYANAIHVSTKSSPWLWKHSGSFVLTKRFSSKEEKRRIMAAYYDSSLPGELIGFENKLNVFHRGKSGFDQETAKGLYVYLNSSLLDNYYRQFGGHTQVNAADLKSLHYPSLDSLKRIGEDAKELPLSQNEIDRIINNEIVRMTGQNHDPLQSQQKIETALQILKDLGMPKAQQNERSALTLLALLNLGPSGNWADIERPMLGVTPIMDWARDIYGKEYAPNTRETFRRQTLHQFVDAGLVLYNPDKPDRAVNSPKACYQITPELHNILLEYGSSKWKKHLESYLQERETLAQQYARERNMQRIPLKVAKNTEITLTPGAHSQLIRDIIKEFGPRFCPGSEVIYVGDTGAKDGYFLREQLEQLGVTVDKHGKMPDVVLYDIKRDWLILIESVTSHGPVDGKRHGELSALFANANPGLVYVTAFPDRKIMAKYLADISWETEVWTADAPTHLIHFNGDRFLGPH